MVISVEFRHQVAIVGRVTDSQTAKALGGVQVHMTDAPSLFVNRMVGLAKLVSLTDPALAPARTTLNNPAATTAQKLQAAQTILDVLHLRRLFNQKLPDSTQTAADGLFFFVDLPDGNYRLVASLKALGTRYGIATVTAIVASNNGEITRVATDLALPPTTVRGQVRGESSGGGNTAPLRMATIQVKGSNEFTHSNGDGNYLLTGVESGARQLIVSARGYQTQELNINLNQAGVVQVINFTLTLPP
jgi:hypothetical protein